MGIVRTNTEITDTLTSQPVDWLLANVGDKIRIVHEFKVEQTAIASEDNPMVFNYTNGVIGGGWIYDPQGQFGNYKIGDSVLWGDYVVGADNGDYTISDKIGTQLIQLNPAPADPPNTAKVHAIISIRTPITGMRYRYNFIENNEGLNFFSKVDGSEQVLIREVVDASNNTPLPMEFLGSECYQAGEATIQGEGIVDTWQYYSNFKIIFDTFVTPVMLAEQLADAKNGIAPLYFQNLNCLKYVCGFDAMYIYTDPNRKISETFSDVLGETGWFNENFNTGLTNYFIDDTEFIQTVPVLANISAVELTQNAQIFRITVKNTLDTPFVNNQTKFVVGFAKCPFDETEYQGNGRDLRTNFVFDRAQSTVGAAAVQGELSGITGMRVLKDVVANFISSSEIQIVGLIEFGDDAFDIINESSVFNYMMFVTVANHTLDTNSSDKVNLLIGPDEYYINNTDPGMIQIQNIFLRHFETDPLTEGVSAPDLYPTDDVAPCGLFFIDRLGRETDDISIRSVTMRVKAKNAVTLDEFTLDEFVSDLSAAPIINGYQYINQNIPRQFHIPSTEVRKTIVVTRRDDLDTATKFYYGCNFPFLVRWMYWAQQQDNNGAFFNTSLPLNGFNQFWQRYGTVADWSVYYEIVITAEKNGAPQRYSYEQALIINDYDTNPDWIQKHIKSFDGSTELAGGGNKYINGYSDTRIETKFRYDGLSVPLLSDLAIRFWIEIFEQGGVDGARRFSSVYEGGSDTWFKSIDLSDKIVLSQTGPGFNVFGNALLDYLEIPAGATKFTVYSRIYDKRLPVGGICGINARRTEDELCRTLENGDPRNVE